MKNLVWILSFPFFFTACAFQERMPIEMVTLNQAQPLGREKSIETSIRFDIGSLEISSDREGTSLYSFNLEYDKATFSPETNYRLSPDGTEGRFDFNLQSTHKLGIHPQSYNNKMLVSINKTIPLDLVVKSGVGDAHLSLSGLKVSGVDIESGVGEAKMSAYEPNPIACEYIRLKNGVGKFDAIGLGYLNFRRLEFEGGVGGADLDFTGDWKQNADIRIKVGVGGVHIRLPRELGVKVEAEKNFLSGLHLEDFDKQGSYYYSKNYDKASIRVSIDVSTGIGGLRITWL
jgi:hypothetical protein